MLPVALHSYNRRQAKNGCVITGSALRPEPLAASDKPPCAVSRLHLEAPLLAAHPGPAAAALQGQGQQRPAGLNTLLQQQMQGVGSWQLASLGQPDPRLGEQPQLPHHAVPQVSGQNAGWQQTAELQLAAEHRIRSALLKIAELPDTQPAGSGAAGGCLCGTGFSQEASPEEEDAAAEDDSTAPASSVAATAQDAAAPAADAAAAEGVAARGNALGCEASAAPEDATAPSSSRGHPEAAAAREAAAADSSFAGAAGAAAPGHCCSSTCVTAAAAGMAGAEAGAAVEEEEGPGPGDRRRRRRQVQAGLAPGSLLEASVGLAGGRTKRVPGGDPLAVSSVMCRRLCCPLLRPSASLRFVLPFLSLGPTALFFSATAHWYCQTPVRHSPASIRAAF